MFYQHVVPMDEWCFCGSLLKNLLSFYLQLLHLSAESKNQKNESISVLNVYCFLIDYYPCTTLACVCVCVCVCVHVYALFYFTVFALCCLSGISCDFLGFIF